MDNAGYIVTPGLYALTFVLHATAAPTTPGLYAHIAGLMLMNDFIPLDPLGPTGLVATQIVVPIQAPTLPFGVVGSVTVPTDDTAAYAASWLLIRAIYP